MFKQPHAGSLFAKHVRVITMPVVCYLPKMGSSERPLLGRLGHQAPASGSTAEFRSSCSAGQEWIHSRYSVVVEALSLNSGYSIQGKRAAWVLQNTAASSRQACGCICVQSRRGTDGAETLAEHVENQIHGFSS